MTKIEQNNKEQLSISQNIKLELFNNPFKIFIGFLKRLGKYFNLCFIQFRNPAFLLEMDQEYSIKSKGIFFPILFRFLNPLGNTSQNKIEKIDKGYIAFIKEGVSLLLVVVLIQLLFKDIAGKDTTGDLMLAYINSLILIVFYFSLKAFTTIGSRLTRKIEDEKISRKVQEIFVYECSMFFGFAVFLMLLESFGIVGKPPMPNLETQEVILEGSSLTAVAMAMFLPPIHIIYLLMAINRRVKIMNGSNTVFWGITLAFVSMFVVLFPYIYASSAGSGILSLTP